MIERKKDRDKLFVHVCLSSFCLIDIWYKRDVYFAPRPRFPASQFDAGNREMSSWPIFIILPAFSYNIRIKVINRRMLLDFLPHFVNGEEEGGGSNISSGPCSGSLLFGDYSQSSVNHVKTFVCQAAAFYRTRWRERGWGTQRKRELEEQYIFMGSTNNNHSRIQFSLLAQWLPLKPRWVCRGLRRRRR